ncbi:TetR/AcrR family transcriptional regulator [Rhodococcus sp. KBS0724]|uniref:TetR/AcrR family transcriptional regulator n=1 Tax=Rhodococcus sp. KBS0724 TaxID=1179674 RepID=UPI00110E4A2C|nr:TetR/AcrR family transcriptional regulator [Rhodococcus sp. KBS0724]TSD40342.1 TetR/AcrR family transcriptional regulator [Rhodococcus sp. KBS0724]
MTKISNLDELLDAAARVFTDKGYTNARLEDIANEVGMLKGSLYYHVGSKADLLRLVRMRRFVEIAEALEHIAELPGEPRDKLRQAIRRHLEFITLYIAESPQWFRNPTYTDQSTGEGPEEHDLLNRLIGAFKRIIDEGVEDGTISSSIDRTVFVMSTLGMCNWVSRWYDSDGPNTIDEIADIQFDLLWSGVTTPAAATEAD